MAMMIKNDLTIISDFFCFVLLVATQTELNKALILATLCQLHMLMIYATLYVVDFFV